MPWCPSREMIISQTSFFSGLKNEQRCCFRECRKNRALCIVLKTTPGVVSRRKKQPPPRNRDDTRQRTGSSTNSSATEGPRVARPAKTGFASAFARDSGPLLRPSTSQECGKSACAWTRPLPLCLCISRSSFCAKYINQCPRRNHCPPQTQMRRTA